MRQPKQQKQPLNDLSRSLTLIDLNHTFARKAGSSPGSYRAWSVSL